MVLRPAFRSLYTKDCEHPGMAWMRLLPGHDNADVTSPYHQHVRNVAKSRTDKDLYLAAFTRWAEAMKDLPGTVLLQVTTAGPLAIGLGTTSPIDIGISLHHTYGVPYLPGSSLKGLSRKAAADFALTAEQISILFGDADKDDGVDNAGVDARGDAKRGYITFWDGWLDPGRVSALTPDVITVHHPGYYASQGVTAPTDFDDPNPVAFLSIPPGTRFHLALSAPDAPDWLPLTVNILTHGLAPLGLGAKTAVGYGRFTVEAAPVWPEDR